MYVCTYVYMYVCFDTRTHTLCRSIGLVQVVKCWTHRGKRNFITFFTELLFEFFAVSPLSPSQLIGKDVQRPCGKIPRERRTENDWKWRKWRENLFMNAGKPMEYRARNCRLFVKRMGVILSIYWDKVGDWTLQHSTCREVICSLLPSTECWIGVCAIFITCWYWSSYKPQQIV